MMMVRNILVSALVMVACITVQCVVVNLLLGVLLKMERKHVLRPTLLRGSSTLTLVLLVMMLGIVLQIAVWALLFRMQGEFSTFNDAFYHSAVNFTTLGYGDMVMSPRRRLLGALEAANGVLMFGLTTSILFSTLSLIMRSSWDRVARRHLPGVDESRD